MLPSSDWSEENILPISRSYCGNCGLCSFGSPLLITLAALGNRVNSTEGKWQERLKPQDLPPTPPSFRNWNSLPCPPMPVLSGHGAKELTQDSLFSFRLHPVLAFGVGSPAGLPS